MSTSKKITENEALEDVEARFLIHLPEQERVNPDRLLFRIQEASWFYDDFYCDNNPHLPRYNFKRFTKRIFQHCPLFSGMENDVDAIFREFGNYRSQIPVYGCIALNTDLTKLLLANSWNGQGWTFPRGKVNQNESPKECAIREMYEESGFDVSGLINDRDSIRFDEDNSEIELFIIPNIPESTAFKPVARKETSKLEFFPIDHLPTGVFAVKQFISKLKLWIKAKKSGKACITSPKPSAKQEKIIPPQTAEKGRKASNGRSSSSGNKANKKITINASARISPSALNAMTFNGESANRWSVNDMFKANAMLTGKKSNYDGNPHNFGDSYPRFVDYNSRNGSASKSDGKGGEFDFEMLSSKAEEFHKYRGVDGVPTELIERDIKSNEVKSTPATAEKKSKKPSNTAAASASEVKSVAVSGPPTLFKVEFKIDVGKVMNAIDEAVKNREVAAL